MSSPLPLSQFSILSVSSWDKTQKQISSHHKIAILSRLLRQNEVFDVILEWKIPTKCHMMFTTCVSAFSISNSIVLLQNVCLMSVAIAYSSELMNEICKLLTVQQHHISHFTQFLGSTVHSRWESHMQTRKRPSSQQSTCSDLEIRLGDCLSWSKSEWAYPEPTLSRIFEAAESFGSLKTLRASKSFLKEENGKVWISRRWELSPDSRWEGVWVSEKQNERTNICHFNLSTEISSSLGSSRSSASYYLRLDTGYNANTSEKRVKLLCERVRMKPLISCC